MDVFDIFKQLTCGATFKPQKRKVPIDRTKSEIKNEEDGGEQIGAGNNSGKVFSEEKLRMLHKEKINHLRNKHHINIHGDNPPDPIETFEQLVQNDAVPQQVINNLSACGYKEPTPIQRQAIPMMANGKSLLACAPTGSGKTAAFLVPIIRDLKKPLKKGFRAVILCPTRELAKQTQRECFRLVEGIGLKVHTLNKTNNAENKYGADSNQQFDILITTPNRVCFLLDQKKQVLDLKNTEWLILDEADKLFEEGKNSFRKQFDTIFKACTSDKLKVGLFSATWTMPVSKWAKSNLKSLYTISIGQRNSATETIDQELVFVGSEAGKMLALRELLRTGLKPPALVFVDSKDRAQQLYSELIYDAINVDVIHADHTQQQRDDAVKAFREGKTWVLICTELISRGIDFLGVNLVINFDFPQSAISYIHRIGRTGRASRRGRAITYFTQDDKPKLRSIANILKNSGCNVPDYMLTLKKRSKKVRMELERTAVKREDIAVRDPTKKESKKGGLKRKANKGDATNGNAGENAAKKRKTSNESHGKENQMNKRKASLENQKASFENKNKSNQAKKNKASIGNEKKQNKANNAKSFPVKEKKKLKQKPKDANGKVEQVSKSNISKKKRKITKN